MATKRVRIPENWLTIAEVVKICKCGERTVKNWVNAKVTPNAFEREQVGRRYYFDVPKLLEWLSANQKTEEYKNLKRFDAAKKRDKPSQVKPETGRKRVKQQAANAKRKETNEQKKVFEGLSGNLEEMLSNMMADDTETDWTCYTIKNLLGKLISLTTVRLAAEPKAIYHESKELRDLAKIFQSMEIGCLDIDERLKHVIPVSEAQKFIGHMISKVKNDVMFLANKVVDDVRAAPTRDEAIKVIQKAGNDCLRHLSEDLINDANK